MKSTALHLQRIKKQSSYERRFARHGLGYNMTQLYQI
jgi:hypothetical protein